MNRRTDRRGHRAALSLRGAVVASAGFALCFATAVPAGASSLSGSLDPAASTAASTMATGGCGKAPTMKNGTYSLQVNGKNRTYILRLPDNYNNKQEYRLVFAFHWLGGNATDVANGQTVQPYYGLQSLANNSTIFVAPQGLTSGMGSGWANSGNEDLAFVDSMIKTIEADLCVDTTQLFSLGFSYGGGMSYAIACDRPDVFRAVAIYSGAVLSGCSAGSKPIAYMQAHGVSDTVLNISSARTMRDRFARNNGCTAQNPTDPNQGSRTHTKITFSGCSAGHPLVWYGFDGGHTPVPQDNSGTWLPAETWKFFSQFKTATTSSTK
ncbi:MAG: hypothetical protein QG608_2017 [Actinomycetota bacterium]|nr:hypothetical protein [Actinomycetota bacterium]